MKSRQRGTNLGLRLGLFWALAISPAWADRAPAEIRSAVESLIAIRHPTPDLPGRWKALGPSAPAVIIEMAKSTTEITDKTRLLEGLSFFNDTQTLEFLKGQAGSRESDENSVLRNTALRSLVRAGGESVVSDVEAYARSDDPQTRIALIEALRTYGGVAGRRLAEAASARESVDWVKRRLKDQPPAVVALKVVSTNLTPASSDLTGAYDGFWIELDRAVPRGIFQSAVRVVVGPVGSPSALYFDAKSKYRKGALKIKKLALVTDQGVELTIEKQPSSENWLTIKGELVQRKGALSLEFKLAELGVTLVLKKSD